MSCGLSQIRGGGSLKNKKKVCGGEGRKGGQKKATE